MISSLPGLKVNPVNPSGTPLNPRPSFSYALTLFLVLAVLIILLLVNGYVEVQRTRKQLFNLLETEGQLLIRGIETQSGNLLNRFLSARGPGSSGLSEGFPAEEVIGLEDLLIEGLVDFGLRLDQAGARRSPGGVRPEDLLRQAGLDRIFLAAIDPGDPVFSGLKKEFSRDPAFQKLLAGAARLFVYRNETGDDRNYRLLLVMARRFDQGLVVMRISTSEYQRLAYQVILQGLLNEFAGKGNLAYLEISDPQGRILAQTGGTDLNPEIKTAWRQALPEKQPPVFWIKRGGEEFLELTRPLETAGQPAGSIRIGLSLKEVTPLLYQSRKQVLFLTGTLLALGLVSLLLIFQIQSRQFRRMQEMEEQLRLQEELSAMGKLAAGVAHEIKNPLNAIGLVVQRLQKEFNWADPKTQQEYDRFTRIVRDEISRVNRIVDQFLFVARPDHPEREEQSVAGILDYVLALMEEEFRERQITVERLGETTTAPVLGDRFQLTQALINIVNNAVESMPGGGSLRISVTEASDPREIAIRIQDSGSGIPPENLKKIFAHYYTTKEKGVGLGLAITQKIIQSHGGTLRVESEPNRGTAVIIRLPRRERKNSA